MGRPFLKFIAYMQVITIILVVFGHSFHEYPDGKMGESLLIYRMLYSFRMPLFMFVSGLLLAYTSEKTLEARRKAYVSNFVKGKLKRLMIPFVTLTAVTFIPRTLLSGLADDNIDFSLESFFRAFVYFDAMPIPFFWFLQSSFTLLIVCFLYMAFTSRIKVSRMAIDIFLIAAFAVIMTVEPFGSFFSLDKTAKFCVYFAAGISYCHFMTEIDRVIPWTSVLFLMAITCLWIWLFFIFSGTAYMVFCSLAGIMMVMSLAKIIECRRWRFLDHLMGANYMIFLLSWYFNVLSQQVLSHFVTLPWYVHTILSFMTGIYIPWLVYRQMLAHPESKFVRGLAFIFGQSLMKKL